MYANLPSFSKERYYSPKRINLMRTQCLDLDLIRAIKGEVFKTKGRRFGWLPKVFEKNLHYHLIARGKLDKAKNCSAFGNIWKTSPLTT